MNRPFLFTEMGKCYFTFCKVYLTTDAKCYKMLMSSILYMEGVMKNNGDHSVLNEEKRQNILSSLAVGAALGVVFWSALEGLLPAPLDFAVGMITGLLLGYNIAKRPFITMRYPPSIIRRLLLAGAASVLGMFAYRFFLGLELNRAMYVLSSLLAIVPAIGFVYAIATAIASLDEMQRRIQTEGIAIAFAGTAVVVIVVSLFGLAGIPSPNWGWLLVVMVFMWLVGKLWTMWRYK